MDKPNFKVIIVGGSIAGLTLAHCLRQANIDHVVLEKGEDVAPQLGASVGIFPNGGRILQQLGLFDEVEALVDPIRVSNTTFPDGFMCRSLVSERLEERYVSVYLQ
jgi:FAD dependent monooxygenase